MRTNSYFNGIENFYLINDNCEIGFYSDKGEFIPDNVVSVIFKNYSKSFIEDFYSDSFKTKYLIGKIEESVDEKWKSPTLIFEDKVIRKLFPNGRDNNETKLSNYQKSMAKKSIFQGMESFLDYKNPRTQNHDYIPIIIDRGLDSLEILNFIGSKNNFYEENIEYFEKLAEIIYTKTIHTELRKSLELELI